jgi:hypothetical protein
LNVAPSSLALCLLTSVSLVAVHPAVAAPRPAAAGKAAGKSRASTVFVRSTTPGARIFIDGESVGTTPQKLPVALAPGAHTIKVSKPGHSDYLDTFQLKRGQDLVLEIDLLALAGILQVNATAPEAIVAIDQRQLGTVPFEGEITPGAHVLEVRAPGHTTFRQDLSVIAGELYAYDVQLVALAPGAMGGDADTPWYGHWWVWAGAAAVVAGGVTAGLLLSRSEPEAAPRNQLPISLSDR